MRPKIAAISETEIEDALRRSGYLIEYRIEQVLRDEGYHVAANETYPDPITGKPRELDLSATGAERIASDKEWLFSMLLIECVNNPYPLAFLSKETQTGFVHVYDIMFSGLPAHIFKRTGARGGNLAEYLKLDKMHHYCAGRTATQFCSFQPKKNTKPIEWMAWHEEGHFESFSKLCQVVNYSVEHHFQQTVSMSDDSINLQTYYPIVVVGGELLDISHEGNCINIETTNHAHYVQSYIREGTQDNYHIDVVTEKYFPTLVKLITSEVEQIAKQAVAAERELHRTIDRMAKAAKRTPKELKAIICPHDS
jgi:hypothetical protein